MPFGIIFRSIALFAIVFQLRFISGDLADTAVFAVTLSAAFAAALFLAIKTKPRRGQTLAALVSIGLIPWLVRLFIAIPRLLISGNDFALAVDLDSLLLNFDRNNFVALLPFYWAALSTLFSIRSRKFLRAAIIIDIVTLAVIFGFTPISDYTLYRWPILLITVLAGIIFMQSLALLFSLPPEINLRRKERAAAIIALLLLVFMGGLVFLQPSQERAVKKGGGLLEPKLFSFDFSQLLRLDTEISIGDDLILIVKKDPRDDHIFLRRSVLSGYNKKQGFFRIEDIDEKTHPQRLPSHPLLLYPAEFKMSQELNQEYYLVNFDAAAFIGMKEPMEIIPYESWDSSSFKTAYAVESLVSNFNFERIMNDEKNSDSIKTFPPNFDYQQLGLSEKEFAIYTSFGSDERILALAEELTYGINSYAGKIQMIHDWLKYGDFRYSLKPGIAPDGDQLAWFLFNSKKGYCSYYAFAMTLMLRSLGIPARVAAGFFIDPEDGAFDYYPVRSDMAHAWVEVPFPGYGWIEFDPTTESLAEGEEFRFSAGVDPKLFERLMREILENRSKLRVKMGQDSANTLINARSLVRLTAAVLKKILIPVLILFAIILFVIIKFGYLLLSLLNRNKRRKAVYLWKHARRKLRRAGLKNPPSSEGSPSSEGTPSSEGEWALRCDSQVPGIYAMYLGAAAARFAPEYHDEDLAALHKDYRVLCESLRKHRRIRCHKLLLLVVLMVLQAAGSGQAQNDDSVSTADELYQKALMAEYSEFWERAIDLLKEGGEKYPQDIRFPRALGRLYYSRSLYGLAWDEYCKAEIINPFDSYILHRLANTAGYLNNDRTSVAYLEKVLAIDPDNREAISNLGWMYYKVHRLEDGERLLAAALERFGEDADFSMTLGTLYSDMYYYDEAKFWYQKAIALSESMRNFSAVAHYNLSILESRFYQFDNAIDEANASLDAQNRASGLLARGELNMWRLDLEKAQADFQAAREIDPSPLAKLNLAQTYQISGRLDEARLYALDCLKAGDQSWMINYGIDPIRYKRDIHDILYKTYKGLAQSGRFELHITPFGKIRGILTSISYRFYAAVNRKLYQKYSLAAGDAYSDKFIQGDAGAPPLEQYIQYYNTFETYPSRALYYINKAQAFETAIIPASEGSYSLEKGILLNDRSLTAQAIDELDPIWERELLSKCYREFAIHGIDRRIRQSAAEELFALNRGALLQAGIGLPLEISIYNAGTSHSSAGKERTLRRALAAVGFYQVKTATRFKLDIIINNGSAVCELIDSESTVKPLRRIIPLQSQSIKDIHSFAAALRNFIFRVE